MRPRSALARTRSRRAHVPPACAGACPPPRSFMLASGEVFGRDQPISLSLLGSERSREALEGVAMELEDR